MRGKVLVIAIGLAACLMDGLAVVAAESADQILAQACERRTCAADYPGQCGTGLSDGCGGTVSCNTCSGPMHVCVARGVAAPAGVAGTCCSKKACATDYPGRSGKNLSDGCGGTLTCAK